MLVLVALMLPVIIGFSGLVLDVGNWFAHKRHLQTQADAGALAGAGKFRFPCDDTPILEEVSNYSSVDTVDISYNPQIGVTPPEELHQEINSPTWHDQATPVDDTVRTGGPCEAKMIDVKLTETNLPWWLKAANVPYINTHARVEIRQQTISAGALPVAVPDVKPKKVRAIFVDETKAPGDAGYVIATTDLVKAQGSQTWSNVALPVPVAINSSRIGVRVAVSGSNSTACGDPLVVCYDAGSGNGLAFIRGWSGEPAGGATTTTPPQARSVELFGNSCEDGYFTAAAAACTVNVGAVVDFGGPVATSRLYAKKTGTNNNTAVELTAPATPGEQWVGGGISIGVGSGPTSIDLMWRTGCDTDRSRPCNTTLTSLGTVQRTFAASAGRSGPVKLVRVSETGRPGANSFERCSATVTNCTHDLVVTVGLAGSLENADGVDDPFVSLKVAGGGSQNQALDCDPATANLRDELGTGCSPKYEVNEGTSCPGQTNVLWGSTQPWQCVAVNLGATVGQVTQGMNLRMMGDAHATDCSLAPNNWQADFPDFSPGDPRIVQLFLTPFGAFSGTGSTTVPVIGFATFYVTGWHNGPCQGQGDDPAGQGSIVGHFIKYVSTLNNGGGGEEFCDFDALGSCVAVFTR